MRKKMYPAALGLALLAATAAGGAFAQQQVQARVVATTQVTEPDGRISYNVTYDYQGREYTTRTDTRPGSTIPVEVGPYGVATSMPVAPQPQLSAAPVGGARNPWDDVVPEQGVVVSAGQPAPPVYYAPPVYRAPVYVQPPMYVAPAYGYGYGYAPAYAYPPIGLSLNLGYSRGWGGHGGRWR